MLETFFATGRKILKELRVIVVLDDAWTIPPFALEAARI